MDDSARGRPDVAAHQVYRFESFALDAARRELERAGRPVRVEPKAFAILLYLVERADRVVSKSELRDAIWPGEILSEGVLTRSVWAARKAVGDDGSRQSIIRTVQRSGYRFVAPLVVGGEHKSRRAAPPSSPTRSARPPDSATSAGGPPPFVGRQRELHALDEALGRAALGERQVVVVSGEAGVGKSRLVEELELLASRRGFEVLDGAVPHGDGVPPYWPWRDAFEQTFRSRDRSELAQALGAEIPLLAEVFPDLRSRFPDRRPLAEEPPPHVRQRLFSAVDRLIAHLAQARPLLVSIEDAHWADPSSLMLLRFLQVSRMPARVVLLAAFRTFDLPRDDPRETLRQSIQDGPGCTRIDLQGLDPADAERLAESVAGRRLDTVWGAELARRSEGHPLTLIELVHLLDARGDLLRAPERARAPSGSEATLARRLDRLSSECVALLEEAAVFGREFRVGLVHEVSLRSEAQILRALDEAEAAYVVEPTEVLGSYRFRHALFRDAVYGRLATSERVRLHQRCGQVLLELHGSGENLPLSDLAHHFSRSPFHDDQVRAYEYLCQLAREAARSLAFPEAARHYERAIEMQERISPSDAPRSLALLYGLGVARRGAGDHARAALAFQRAVELARGRDPIRFARAAVALSEALYTARQGVDASVPILQEALGVEDPALRVQVLDRLAADLNVLNDPRRIEISAEAVRLAREVGDELVLAHALIHRHVAIWGPDSLEERLAIGRELLDLGAGEAPLLDAHGIDLGIWGHERRMSDCLEMGDLDAVYAAIEGATIAPDFATGPAAGDGGVSENARLAVHVEHVRLFRGMLMIMQGEFASAEKLALEVAAACERIQAGNVMAGVQIQLFGLRYLQGRVDEVLPLMQLLLANNPGFSHATRAAVAMALADLGRHDEARAELERLAAGGLRALPRDPFFVSTMTTVAEAAFLADDRRPARELYALLEPFADRTAMSSASYCTGSVSRSLGMLATLSGDLDRARAHFEVALAKNRALRARPFTAATQFAYARALAASGHLERSAELARAAQSEAAALGMPHLERRARELLPGRQSPVA